MARIIPGIATPLPAGWYQFSVILSSGTVIFQYSADNGATFTTMTDGTISVTSDDLMIWGQNRLFKAVISGDGIVDIDPVSLLHG